MMSGRKERECRDMSNGVKAAVLLLLAVLCGGGFFVGSAYMKSRQMELSAKERQITGKSWGISKRKV